MLPLQEQKAAEKHAGGKAKRSKSEVQAPALEEQVPNDSDDDEVQESDEVEQGMAEVDNVADQDEDSEDERDEEMMGNEEIGANERLLFKEVQRLQRELDEANAETSRAQQARANAEMRLNEAKKTIKTKKKVQFAPQTPAPAPTSGPTASFPVESLADLMRQMTAANEAKEKRDNKSKGLKNFAFAWLAGIDKTKVDVTTRAFVALLELASNS
jgi:RecA/RadA recombinase